MKRLGCRGLTRCFRVQYEIGSAGRVSAARRTLARHGVNACNGRDISPPLRHVVAATTEEEVEVIDPAGDERAPDSWYLLLPPRRRSHTAWSEGCVGAGGRARRRGWKSVSASFREGRRGVTPYADEDDNVVVRLATQERYFSLFFFNSGGLPNYSEVI